MPQSEKIAQGYHGTAGPVFSRRGYLLFSDVPSNRILKWERGEITVVRENSHGAKSNTFDHQGRLLTCETGRVTRTEKDGKITVLAGGVKEPADLVYAIDGSVYFSDPPAGTVYQVTRKGEVRPFSREAEAAANQAAVQASSRPASESAMTPGVSLILNGIYSNLSQPPAGFRIDGFVPTMGEVAPPARGLSLGESELAFAANIDHMFRGTLIASIAPEGGADVEESYIQTLALSNGFTIKAGRFFSAVGYQNQIHAHAWDFADAPLANKVFLGNQLNEDGRAGPIMFGQDSRSCPRLGESLEKAPRVMEGTTLAIGCGPWKFRQSALESMGARMTSKIPPLLESVGGVGVYGRLNLRNRRARRAQNHATFGHFNSSLGISGHREGEAVDEVGAEPPKPTKSATKLGVEGRPADFHVSLEGMESIGEPDIDIDDHGPRPNGPERGLTHGHGVLSEGTKEIFVEENTILPKRRLVTHDV